MSQGKSDRSNRQLVMTFAACLAHWLNVDRDGIVEVQPFDLFLKVTKLLGKSDSPYASLCGRGLFVDKSAEEIATAYFEHVLDRRLFLAGAAHTHKGHQLFEVLCKRGVDTVWTRAEVKRDNSFATLPGSPPADFQSVADRLQALPSDVSKGNPARNTRDTHGPLVLKVPGAFQEVPDEMSIWGGIKSAPLRLKPLETEEFNNFCSLVIKAVETANAQYSALVALGLSPADWSELPVDTAKKASAFRSELQSIAEQSGHPMNIHDIYVWEKVWELRQVPGFRSAREFWESELGRALRQPVVGTVVVLEDEADIESPSREDELLDAMSFEQMVEHAERGSVITAFDAKLLRGLMAGTTFDQLATPAEKRSHLKGRDLRDYIADLCLHLRRHVDDVASRQQERTVQQIHPDKK